MLPAGSPAWQINAVHETTALSVQDAAPSSSSMPAVDSTVLQPNASPDLPNSQQLPLEQFPEGSSLPLQPADHGEMAATSQASSEGNTSTSNVQQKMARPRLRLKWQLMNKPQPRATAAAKQKSILSQIFRVHRSAQL